jgi:pimeloyl-ACP methyl ester carboxylesterase
MHDVKALVYVDAFAPDAGESIQEELASAPPPPADFTIAVPFTTPTGGDADLYVNLYVNSKYFGVVFASSESPQVAARLAVTQRPFATRCLTDKAPTAIGWKTIPSWYVVGDADKVIPPDIQMKFATRAKSKVYHVPGGDHPSMIGHPEVTVAAIEDAASSVAH